MLLMPALILSGIVFLLPFLWLFVTSFRLQGKGSLLMAEGFSAANYARLVSDSYFAEVFFHLTRCGRDSETYAFHSESQGVPENTLRCVFGVDTKIITKISKKKFLKYLI